jgi:hypothetical protein
MSPRFSTPGCRAARTALANGSISEKNSARHPRGPQATDGASIPEHTLPKVIATIGDRTDPRM